MTVYELLQFADKIIIGDANVKKFYETNRLSEVSLREIVKNYLRSGPYEKVFWHELLPDELDILDKHQKINELHEIESNKSNEDDGHIMGNQVTTNANTISKDSTENSLRDLTSSGALSDEGNEPKTSASTKPKNKLPQAIAIIVVFVVLIILLVLLSNN